MNINILETCSSTTTKQENIFCATERGNLFFVYLATDELAIAFVLVFGIHWRTILKEVDEFVPQLEV